MSDMDPLYELMKDSAEDMSKAAVEMKGMMTADENTDVNIEGYGAKASFSKQLQAFMIANAGLFNGLFDPYYIGNFINNHYFLSPDNYGINVQNKYTSLNTAQCKGFLMAGYTKIWLTNSAGDFSPSAGRGAVFFSDRNDYSDANIVGAVTLVNTGEKTPSGVTIYEVTVPANAEILLVNIKYTASNPSGFTVGIYSDLASAKAGSLTAAESGFIGFDGTTFYIPEMLSRANFDAKMLTFAVDGLIPDSSRYLKFSGQGVLSSGNFGSDSNAQSAVIDVGSYTRLYATNSSGKGFSSSAGTGAAFYSSRDTFSAATKVANVVAAETGEVDASGNKIYQIDVPAGAVAMLFNTGWTVLYPSGFVVALYSSLESAKSTAPTTTIKFIKTINGHQVSPEDVLTGSNRAKHFSYVYDGNLLTQKFNVRTNYGVNNQNKYTSVTGVTSCIVPIAGHKKLYLYNSVGNFSPSAGRGFLFFSSATDFSDANNLGVAPYTQVGVATDGVPIFAVTVPAGAVTMVINTAYPPSNPSGFTVGVFTTLEGAQNLIQTSTRAVSAIFGDPLAGGQQAADVISAYGPTRLRGQKFYVFGDSISTTNYNGGWVPYLVDATGCLLTNYAINGSTAARMVDRLKIEGLAQRDTSFDESSFVKPDFTDCKATCLMIGTNDSVTVPAGGIESVIPAGKVSDYSDPLDYWNLFPNNYVGNVALFIEYVKYSNPNTEIYLMSNIHRGDGKTKMENVSALCGQIAAYYSIPHIDATHNAGFTFKFINSFLTDGLHPTLKGNIMLGNFIASAIISGGQK